MKMMSKKMMRKKMMRKKMMRKKMMRKILMMMTSLKFLKIAIGNNTQKTILFIV
jgi:hypothetical protein